MGFIFIAKFIPNPLKTNLTFGDTFGVLFQLQMIWYEFFFKVGSRLKGTMRKAKGSIGFEMLEEG